MYIRGVQPVSIAQRIKELREAAGLSQAELARETGLTRKSIINYENGYREPNSKAMAALERYFHVSGEFLRGDVDATRFMQQSEQLNASIDDWGETTSRFNQDVLLANQAVQLEAVDYVNKSLKILICIMERDEFCAEEIARYKKALELYTSLSSEGQKEMLKRLMEYKVFDLSRDEQT